MKTIQLTKGYETIVDDEDYEKLIQYSWYAKKNHDKYYAQRRSGMKHFQMHDEILNPPKGKTVDHINGNSLDNRKCNLRPATQQEQCFNRIKRSGTSSIYKGVSFNKYKRKWQAYICKDHRQISLGTFDDEERAAIIYDKAAVSMFGDKARTNFTVAEYQEMIRDMSETLSKMSASANQIFGSGVQTAPF